MTRVRLPSPAPTKRGESPLNRRFAILGAASALLFVVGIVLALAKPGNLGDDTDTAAGTTTSSSSSSSPSSSAVETTTSVAETTTSAADTSTTSAPASTTTTAPSGSGLGTGGAGSVDSGTTANTGGPAWLLPVGGALLAAGLGTRRLAKA